MFDNATLCRMSTPVLTVLAAFEVWQLHRPFIEEFDRLKVEPHIDAHSANLHMIDDVLKAREQNTGR